VLAHRLVNPRRKPAPLIEEHDCVMVSVAGASVGAVARNTTRPTSSHQH